MQRQPGEPIYLGPVHARIKRPFGLQGSGTWSTLKNGFGPVKLRVDPVGIRLDFAGRLGRLLVPGLVLDPRSSTMSAAKVGFLGLPIGDHERVVLSGPSPRGPLQMAVSPRSSGPALDELTRLWTALLAVGVQPTSDMPQ
jgi:hypothetical protein